MRILHLITGLGLGGAETQLATLAIAMQRSGHVVEVVSLMPGGHNADRLRAAGVPVLDLGMRRGIPGPGAIWRLLRVLRRFQPEVLQSWLYHADLLALFATAFHRRTALFWNLRCSRLDPRDHGQVLFAVIRLLARLSRRPQAVVANAASGKKFHADMGYRPREWEIIPNALDTETFRPAERARGDVRAELGLSESTPLVGLVARYHPMKDHVTFLKAAALAGKMRPETHFVLVGPGVNRNNSALTGAVRELRIEERVHLLGGRTDIERLQAAWDVAVCSSYSEGFPNVLGEAMSCGVPCVSADVGDARLVIGDTGEIVPPRQAEALATAIGRMLDLDPAERRALGQRARQRVVDNFSTAAAVERYLNLYRRHSAGGRKTH